MPLLLAARLAVLAAGLVAVSTPALSQTQVDERLPIVLPHYATATTGSVSAPAAAGPPGWSGLPGASGHPLMTSEAIQAAAADFDNCIERLWPAAARRGVSREAFVSLTAGVTPDLRIMDLLDSQPEFTKSFWDYLDLLVNEPRIQKGREMLARYKAQFDAAEKTYGVDRHVVAAIWGVETKYGALVGDRPVLRSTATLACVGRRQPYFTEEFLSSLEILARGDVKPEHLVGSWAGAFGPTQFMPTAFKRYAVDGDGDGRRDVVTSMTDMIASTANNLKKDGWVSGQSWGYEVIVPPGFDYMLADRSHQLTVRDWERLGVKRVGGKPFPRAGDKAYLLAPAGARGPGFLMLNNFRVIMKYNPAEAYALAIGHLADRLRGGEAFVQAWPRDERVLSRTERLELQQRLAAAGFDVGEPDGRLGGKTRAAVRSYQAAIGVAPDGFASESVLERLRRRQ